MPTSPEQTVIFDLGGVLLQEAENNLHKAKSDALIQLLTLHTAHRKMFNRAFDFAQQISGKNYIAEWITGTTNADEIVTLIKDNIDNNEYDSFFNNEQERSLIKHAIEFVIMPDLLVSLTELIPAGLAFVEKCKKNNITVGIISNWDPASFRLIIKKMPHLFEHFNQEYIIIPCMVGKKKPSPEIYDYAIKKMKADPSQCFFIDDSAANVMGAHECGLKAVLHKNWQDTEQKLIDYGLRLKN